ncbi:presqualene diphosphate synthase HpnD [Vitreoscilla stercoraria]|uniref:Presqualene diphosphate synthase HpnD n=1 Tax=Vitreoscilla stercoraria TaxID=61 RepID=A0ABY4E9J1_VITST|nr:presqualene diphosphate synthase HpnD [Vitreoscilla stercoraria]UOO91924.1 presqualene diphosphate synthase HpnD [Vitreoscilla stercoraria]
MDSLAYCQQKAAASGSNFLVSFKFLSQSKKDALTIIYAFCREVDDIVDDCTDANVAMQTLQWWRQDLAKVFVDGEVPEHPVHQAIASIKEHYQLPQEEFVAIIDGMQMDLQQARYNSFGDLQLYCHRVAGVVGRLIVRVLGFKNPQTLEYADKMGLALQLTNIIRDVGEDVRNGRIYLPVEDLQKFFVLATDLMALKSTPEFEQMMQFQIDRANRTYQEAMALLPPEDKQAQKIGFIMAAIYHTLLDEIQKDGGHNVLRYKIAIPNPRKLRIALKTWLFGFKP